MKDSKKNDKKISTAFGDAVVPNEIDLSSSIPVSEIFTDVDSESSSTNVAESKVPSKGLNNTTNKNASKQKNFSDDSYSGLNLFKMDYEKLPTLIDPIFPQVGLVSLIGSSDTGKSTFLRQLALSIVLGLNDFIGYKINSRTRNVIFVSTEDDPASTSVSIKKPLQKLLKDHQVDDSALNHLKFIFDVDLEKDSSKNLFKVLNKDLSEVGADLIIIDAFTDVFSGDINSSTKVREFLSQFSKITKKHNCLVLFLHHTGKNTSKYSASKNNALGSQAFEAKMRVMLELKHYPNDEYKRTVTITKGNYISTEIKKDCKVLDFNEDNLLFSFSGKTIPVSAISTFSKVNSKKDKIMPLVAKYHKEGKSVRKIEELLKNQGFRIGKSTVANYIKETKEADKLQNHP